MTTLLALDTSTDSCSVALWHQGQLWQRALWEPRAHTRLLMPMVRELLADAGASLNALDAIAFGSGPGSFTGLRITVGVVQGLAYGLDCPVIPVSSLAATAHQAARLHGARQVAVAFDARMDEVYWGCFRCEPLSTGDGSFFALTPLAEERVCAPEQVALPATDQELWFAAGSGWCYQNRMPSPLIHSLAGQDDTLVPLAEDIVRLALADWQAGKTRPALDAQPVYLRNEITWKKLPGR